MTSKDFAKKVHKTLPKDLKAAIPWTLLAMIVLELLKGCALNPAQVRSQVIRGLARRVVLMRVRRMLTKNGINLDNKQSALVVDALLSEAQLAPTQEFQAVMEEAANK